MFNESSVIDIESEETWRTQFGQENQANGIEASENRPTILSREKRAHETLMNYIDAEETNETGRIHAAG